MANKRLLIKAAEKFIEKCETGRARSVTTYRELKLALETPEDVEPEPLTRVTA